MTDRLNVDLETYVIDYEEVKAVLRSQMKAGLPWIDAPTDMAIISIIMTIAKNEGVKYVLSGSDFRSEGKQPNLWTYTDSKLLYHTLGKYEKVKLSSFPISNPIMQTWTSFVHKIKIVKPFYFLDYNKLKAQEFLSKKYGWENYGGHHHENIFTKFAISYWMYEKFGIDKRIITFSAQVINGEMTRNEAVSKLKSKPYDVNEIEDVIELVSNKLDFTQQEFETIWENKNKSFLDYPSFYNTIMENKKLVKFLSYYLLKTKPKFLYLEE